MTYLEGAEFAPTNRKFTMYLGSYFCWPVGQKSLENMQSSALLGKLQLETLHVYLVSQCSLTYRIDYFVFVVIYIESTKKRRIN